ncbi:riboflavin synthase domain-like protein [Tilletiaria anomala UBC 951]|uniref:NADPH-dependent diflavin oxidoreductase 1 n=1 Tax=Tilletiaria anomala (strain ATCC 24038 / CBS 436.72 / UBC 951) TaxID=1037660 RepID=A0A066VL08_TILAU|nr:riboflavin synthase domain-like protein [Tilletiaria anomala UBC 951]KDN39260.1 riboflavin synthase domain-like protein [Tilletiaria anomala UBC 951]
MAAAPPLNDADARAIMERRVKVIYASQTGNAEDVADRIAQLARRKRFGAQVLDIADYDVTELVEEPQPVIFIISTTGLGDFPSSARPFWRFLLRKDLPVDILSDLNFTVFGLGDSSYAKFCWPARLLRRRLESLGAVEYVKGEDADDQHPMGIEGALVPFLQTLFTQLQSDFVLPTSLKEIPEYELLPPQITVRLLSHSLATGQTSNASAINGSATSNGKEKVRQGLARLTRNERMTARDHWQDVRLLEFEHVGWRSLSDDLNSNDDPERECRWLQMNSHDKSGGECYSDMKYEAGDIFCVKAHNSDAHVDRFFARMGWSNMKEELVQLECLSQTRKLPPDIPRRLKLSDLVKSHLDICSVPRPSFFHTIRQFSPAGSMEREKLDEYCTPGEGADDMFDYAMRVRRTILEVLEEFQSVNFGLERLCEVVPFTRERQFSIASSAEYLDFQKSGKGQQGKGASLANKRSSDKVQLAVAIVKYKTRLREPRRGVCTAWLSALEVGTAAADQIPYRIEKGTMRLPQDDTTPVLYIGPGTGVAPMRAFLQQRLLSRERECSCTVVEAKEHDETNGKAIAGHGAKEAANRIFLGFRHSQKDFLFAEEWQRWSRLGFLEWRLAASRESASGEKFYVQDLIKQDSALLWRHIGEQGGYVLISGSSGKMPEAVREALREVCKQEADMDDEQAARFLQAMVAQRRLQEECWS